jgi:hypothetical protein
MPVDQVLEGRWEEIVQQADRLSGKRVRVIVEAEANGPGDTELPFYATATPEERARAWEDWCDLPRPHVPPLSDLAVSRESIYSTEPE